MISSSEGKVHEYWSGAAANLMKGGRKATAPDAGLQQLIEQAMLANIKSKHRLLDIGCGDGFSTRKFAEKCVEVVGVDYVQGFVDLAKKENIANNISYEQADVLNLDALKDRNGQFDVVTTIRCLINLDSWDMQYNGLAQIAQMVRPRGLYLACEGWSDGLAGLNERRETCGLEPIPVTHHNTFIQRKIFKEAAAEFFEIERYVSFGLYLYLSRVVQPLVVRPELPSYGHPINTAALELQERTADAELFEDLDYAGLFVLRRKG